MTEQTRPAIGNSLAGPALAFVAFGVYLFVGAYYGFAHGKWPWFMPPQLDVFGLTVGIFGAQAGGYAGGAFLGILGFASVIAGVAVLVKRDV